MKATLNLLQCHIWRCKLAMMAAMFCLPLLPFFGSAQLSAKTVTGTVTSATDGNTYGTYSSYQADLSYSDPDWWPSWWGGVVGSASVTGDGTYTVYGDTRTSGSGTCQGAVVFTIELYDLWIDLVDTSAISVTIDEITIEQ